MGAEARNDAMEEKLRAAFAAGELEGLHSVLILHRGEVFAEVHFDGEDEAWGTPLGVVAHGPDTLHDLRSVSKSITSLIYGVALSDGLVPPLDASLIDQFPDYADLAADPARRAITVADAFSMQMGVEWDETLPYTSKRNSEVAMEMSGDRYRFVLERPLTGPPGERWVYNGGATAVIGKLIERGVGKPIDVYAREKLFDPLGIEQFEWVRGSDGAVSTASGLRLSIRDLARIGQMVLDGGRVGDLQVVPRDWLEASFQPRAQVETDGLQYGLHWWLAPKGNPYGWVAGFGNGGQRLTINPTIGLVVAVFAGNYNQPDAWRLPMKVVTDFLVPALDVD